MFYDYAAKPGWRDGLTEDWFLAAKPSLTKPDSLKVAKVLKIKHGRL
jgi:hypothetical protein